MRSADFSRRIDERIQTVLTREDLTIKQKREIAETLTIPGTYEVEVFEDMGIEK